MISRLREWIYNRSFWKPVELPACTVSIGNISLGGTGKTPMALWLAEWALKEGIPTGILSRGYKRKSKSLKIVPPGAAIPAVAELGDEPWMMRHRLPKLSLLVHKDRARMALRHWKEFGAPKLVFLDDGFQHWKAARDFDVVMLDATESLDGKTIPFGRLRESWKALRRADLVVITRAEAVPPERLEKLRKRIGKTVLRRSRPAWKRGMGLDHVPVVCADYELDSFFDARTEESVAAPDKSREYLLLSGIAKPEGFRALAKRLGFNVREEMYFPDHHALTGVEEEKVRRALEGLKNGAVLVNEKDWSRWRELFLREGFEGIVVRVRFRFFGEGEKALAPFLHEVKKRCST